MSPVRTCVGCRATDEQAHLVRLVADGAGRILFDVPRRQPGRGAYVHERRECVGEMVGRGALARSLRRKIQAVTSDGLWSRLTQSVK